MNVNVRANVDVPVLSAGTASGQPGQQGQGAQGGQGQKYVGSGGGLSAWAGGEGASGGVAGGTAAGGGVKRVVPRDLVIGIGSMLDDECKLSHLSANVTGEKRIDSIGRTKGT